MDELIEVLDELGNKTGVIKTKQQIKKDGDYHHAISVCLVNDKKEILMHQRSSNKIIYPNLWSCFIRGHIKAYEDSITACLREIKEEMGIDVKDDELVFLYTRKENDTVGNKAYINNIFFDNYIVYKNIDLKDIAIEKDEVSGVKILPYQELKKLINNNDDCLVPNFVDYEAIIKILEQ